MKPATAYLSQYQKEQYTAYLETQLEKFSAFMLAQRKDNEHQRMLEDAVAHQQATINELTSRVDLLHLF